MTNQAQNGGYSLNENEARRVGTSMFIDTKGAYTGVFTRAEAVQSPKGTVGIEFDFKSNDGQLAKYLTVWTRNANGEDLSGRRMVDAILTCIGLRSIALTEGVVTKWDAQKGVEVQVKAPIFAGLMNKPIGLVLHREEYEKTQGGSGWKNQMYCPFEAATNRIAAERLDSKPAEALQRIVNVLTDRPLKRAARPAGGGFDEPQRGGGRAANGFDDMDDDIPF